MCAGSTFSHRSRLSPAAAAGVAHRHRPVRSVDTREPAVSTTKRTSRGEIPPVFGAPMGPGESSGGHMMPGGSMGSQFIGQQSYGDAVSKGYGQPVMYGRPGAAYNPGSAYGGRALFLPSMLPTTFWKAADPASCSISEATNGSSFTLGSRVTLCISWRIRSASLWTMSLTVDRGMSKTLATTP
ncbi:uncharacterized protein LOC144990926 isoform X3 [Oryzias latipes]